MNPARPLVSLVLSLFFTLLAATAMAGAGQLDCTFGDGSGIVITNRGGDESATDVAIQTDGRIVIAGTANSAPLLVRYDTAGNVDFSFGSGGGVNVAIPGATVSVSSVALDSLGRVVVGGWATVGTELRAFVARYTAAGALDTAFNTTGWLTFHYGVATGSDTARDVAVDSSDRIVLAGNSDPTTSLGSQVGAVARFTTAGALDTTFGTNGIFSEAVDPNNDTDIRGMALQSDGSIVAVGATGRVPAPRDARILRLTTSGALDTTFNTTGVRVVDMSNSGADDYAVAVRPDSAARLVVVGGNGIVARLTPAGALDTTFDGDGLASSVTPTDTINSVVVQADDRIVIGGFTSTFLVTVMRFTTAGALDASYGGSGRVTTGTGPHDRGYALALQSNGRVVQVGAQRDVPANIELFRYQTDGDNLGSTTVSILGHTPDPSVVGQPIHVTYSITSASGTPAGAVVVTDGVDSCTGTVASGGCNLVATSAGFFLITVSYQGDSSFCPSSGSTPISHTVTSAATTTTINSHTPNPSRVGGAVSVTVTVAAGAGTPTGNVTIDDGAGATCTATLSGGTGTCALTSVTVGTRSINASYPGDGVYTASSGFANHTFNKATSTTSITSDTPDPSIVGQPFTVNVSVTSSFGTPGGTVTLNDGAGATCTATLASGSGSCNLTPLTAGTRNITATYNGDTTHATSSATTSHTTSKAGSQTVINSHTPNPSTIGSPVAVSVTVSSSFTTPTGTVTVADGAGATCSITLSGGTGSCNLTSITAGTRNITASYAGATNFNTSSTTAAHVFDKAPTTTTITSDTPDPSAALSSVTVAATVASTFGTPAGTVTVDDGTGVTCTITLAGGSGNCSLTPAAAGTRNLTATYGGSATQQGSSGTAPHTVNGLPTTTTITADAPDPSEVGVALPVSVTVTSPSGTPAGSVTIDDGQGASCVVTLASGSGSCSLTASVAGSRNLTASYSGNATYSSSSTTEPHVFDKHPTTTAVVSDTPDPSVVGAAIPVAVIVSSAIGTPDGTVTIDDGGGASCTAALTGGSGSCAWTPLTSGPHTLTATYSGSSSYVSSVATEAHAVSPAATTTTITSDSPDPSEIGNALAVAVTVASPFGTAGGDVTVDDGQGASCTATLSSGSGSCSLTPVMAGSRNLTATYPGDATHLASSATEPHTFARHATTTTIASATPDPSTIGTSVTVTVVVSSPAGTADGSVAIDDGAGAACNATLIAGSGSCALMPLVAGPHTLTATYSGSTAYLPSSATASHVVAKATTTATITSHTPDPSTVFSSVTVGVTVGSTVGMPGGNVTVSDGAGATCSIALAAGSGTCSLTPVTAGLHTMTATYSGSAEHDGSSATASHTVADASTVTMINAVTPDPSEIGVPVTVSVNITTAAGTVAGSVAIDDGEGASCTITLASGSGTCSLTPTVAGTRNLTATYSGDGTHLASSTTAAHTFTKHPTQVVATTAPNPSYITQVVTASVTVSSPSGTPAGNVTISDGDVSCSTLLVNGNGSCSLTFLTTGPHTLVASYSGDTAFAPASSSTPQQVTSAPPELPLLDPEALIILSLALAVAGAAALRRS